MLTDISKTGVILRCFLSYKMGTAGEIIVLLDLSIYLKALTINTTW